MREKKKKWKGGGEVFLFLFLNIGSWRTTRNKWWSSPGKQHGYWVADCSGYKKQPGTNVEQIWTLDKILSTWVKKARHGGASRWHLTHKGNKAPTAAF